MVVLPRERLIGRSAPKSDEFPFIFDERGGQFGVAFLVETADGSRVEGGRAAFSKIGQSIEKRFDILNVPHRTLILVHMFEVRFRIIRNQWLNDFRHVTKLFESKPQSMNGAGLRRIHLNVSLHGSQISIIHRSE
ncbi:MAG TPA: hypothetical protein VLX61_01345 [Anaerolineales bacterium]|nr:hypothetical protein [Anaerolineales bacterium]